MLIFLTPGTCRRSWRITSACRDQLAHRHALGLQRVKGEAHIGIFVVDERAEDAGRQIARLIAELLAGLVKLLLHRQMAACCPSA